ncbi:MAG: hypothetical protein KR126chlam3_01710 [Chlamydiae bacterium]|nr:hypothetical protein [Chlamydiota bacterium]
MQIDRALMLARNFDDLLTLANKAQPHLSFWGQRYVTFKGYDGYLNLDALPKKINNLAKQKRYEFTEQERETGKQLHNTYRNVILLSYFQVEMSNWLTYFLVAIRNLRGTIVGHQWWLYAKKPRYFEQYNRPQYIQTFGFPPPKKKSKYSPPIWRRPSEEKILAHTEEKILAHKFFLSNWIYQSTKHLRDQVTEKASGVSEIDAKG